jgi:hypothetical protein
MEGCIWFVLSIFIRGLGPNAPQVNLPEATRSLFEFVWPAGDMLTREATLSKRGNAAGLDIANWLFIDGGSR